MEIIIYGSIYEQKCKRMLCFRENTINNNISL